MKGWQRVRRAVTCAFGDQIQAPALAYFGRRYGFVLCVDHAQRQYGLVPTGIVDPEPAGAVRDGKAAQCPEQD